MCSHLVLLLADLLAITLACERFFHALLFTWFQIKGVTLDFLDNVFGLHFALKAPQSIFKGFAFLYSNLCQEKYTSKRSQIGNTYIYQITLFWEVFCEFADFFLPRLIFCRIFSYGPTVKSGSSSCQSGRESQEISRGPNPSLPCPEIGLKPGALRISGELSVITSDLSQHEEDGEGQRWEGICKWPGESPGEWIEL